MARLALTVGGALVGGALGSVVPGIGTAFGAQLGANLFGAVGNYLLAPKFKAQGPRLNDLQVQGSAYGSAIPRVWGMARLSGQLIWSSGLRERAIEQSGGGKGGGGGGGSFTTYEYFVSCAVLICEGEIAGVRRIWADSQLIYDATAEPTGEATFAKALVSQEAANRITIYNGTDTQTPDPLIAASYNSTAETPAYRGRAYAVIDDMSVEDFGRRTPNFTFEVYVAGADLTQRAFSELPELTPPAPAYKWKNGVMYYVGVSATSELGTINWWKQVPGQEPQLVLSQSNNPALNVLLAGPPGVGSIIPPDYFFWFPGVGTPAYNSSAFQIEAWDSDVDAVLLTYSEDWYLHFKEPWAGLRYWMKLGIPITATAKDTSHAVFRNQVLALSWPVATSAAFVQLFFITRYAQSIRRYDNTRADDLAATPSGDAVYLLADLGGGNIQVSRIDVTRSGDHAQASAPTVVWTTTTTEDSGDGFSIRVVQDRVWVAIDQKLFEIERGTYTTIAEWGHALAARSNFNEVWVDGNAIVTFSGTLNRMIPHVPVEPVVNNADLRDVVQAVGQLVGANVNADALAGRTVDGFIRTRPMPARALIEPLQQAHIFDTVDVGLQTVCRLRGQATVATITEADFVAGTIPKLTRTQDFELPKRVTVGYVSRPADYQAGTQQALRIVVDTETEWIVDLPMVLGEDQAAQIAEMLLTQGWAGRERVTDLVLGPSHARLEPTDAILVQLNGYQRRVRLTEVLGTAPGEIRISGQVEEASAYTSEATGGAFDPLTGELVFAGPTDLVILDIPLLRSSHTASGVYIGVAGTYPGWRGTVIFRSEDGETWTQTASVLTEMTWGRTLTALGNADPNIIDRGSTVRVELYRGTLQSITEAAFLAHGNVALIGDEIITFQNATLVSGSTYDLTILTRGRRGTEQEITPHAANERFVLLNDSLSELPLDADLRGTSLTFRAVTIGSSLDAADNVTFTFDNVRQRCYAPADLMAMETTTGTWSATWTRRARADGDWADAVDVPLVDYPESYRWRVYTSGGTMIREGTATEPSATITGNAGELLGVAQVNAAYGAGLETRITLGSSP